MEGRAAKLARPPQITGPSVCVGGFPPQKLDENDFEGHRETG